MIYRLFLKTKIVGVKLQKKLEKILKRKNNLKVKVEEKPKNHILFMIIKIIKIIKIIIIIKAMMRKKIKKWILILSKKFYSPIKMIIKY